MIKVLSKQYGKNCEVCLSKLKGRQAEKILKRYADEGVAALSLATPKKSGKTASSWSYEIEKSGDRCSIHWINTNINDGVNIALILQYGHGTANGGYIQGFDYINPAIRPIFDKIANDAWNEVIL